jgi:hypothetical protein
MVIIKRPDMLTRACRDQLTESWLQEYKEHVQLLIGQNWPTEIPKVKIAILDTGIDLSHEWIKLKLKDHNGKNKDFIQEDAEDESVPPQDSCGHGTYAAGIILQLTPHVDLHVARVFENGFLHSTDTNTALDRVAQVIQFCQMSVCFYANFTRQLITLSIPGKYTLSQCLLASPSNTKDYKKQYPMHHRKMLSCYQQRLMKMP